MSLTPLHVFIGIVNYPAATFRIIVASLPCTLWTLILSKFLPAIQSILQDAECQDGKKEKRFCASTLEFRGGNCTNFWFWVQYTVDTSKIMLRQRHEQRCKKQSNIHPVESVCGNVAICCPLPRDQGTLWTRTGRGSKEKGKKNPISFCFHSLPLLTW